MVSVGGYCNGCDHLVGEIRVLPQDQGTGGDGTGLLSITCCSQNRK